MKSGKRHMAEGMELTKSRKTSNTRKENFKYLGIFEADTIKQV